MGEDVPIDLLNNIGVLHFERGEFEVCSFLLVVQLLLLAELCSNNSIVTLAHVGSLFTCYILE